jgi:hypothetical protein
VNSDCSMFPPSIPAGSGVTAMQHASLRAKAALCRSANDAPTSRAIAKLDTREIGLPLARQVSREMSGLGLSWKTGKLIRRRAPGQEVKERAAHAPHLAQ